jgi:hypothetical protein
MLTLVCSKDFMEAIVKSLEGFDSYNLNERKDGTYEIYLGEKNQNDFVVGLDED